MVDIDFMKEGNVSPLILAALKGRKHVVRLLLDRAADPNLANQDGATPLHRAAM